MLKFAAFLLTLFLSTTTYGQEIVLKNKTYKEFKADELVVSLKLSENGADETVALKALKKGAADTIATIGSKTTIDGFKIIKNEYTVNKIGNYLNLNKKLFESEDYCVASLLLTFSTPCDNVQRHILLKNVANLLNDVIEPIIRYTTYESVSIYYILSDTDKAYESLMHDAIERAKLDAVAIAKALGKEKVIVRKINKINSDKTSESKYSSVTLSVELEITFEIVD